MKILNKILIVVSIIAFAFGLSVSMVALAATTPSLGTASTFGVLSNLFQHNIATTTITGDLGYSSTAGTGPVTVSGTTYVNNAVWTQAGVDQGTAWTNLNNQYLTSCTDISGLGPLEGVDIDGAGPLSPGTFTQGCYKSSGAMDITANGIVTLSGAGTFIFRPNGAITTGADSEVKLAGGASVCDVFWIPTAATTLGARTKFVGTDIDASGITIGDSVAWSGRALAYGGTITADTDTITAPSCTNPPTLNVIKTVTNDNGGTASASDWTLTVTSSNNGSGTGSAVGVGSPGTAYVLETGKAYSVAESSIPSGYSHSLSNDCVIASAVAGTVYTCTIANDDIAPQLTVTKVVINDNGNAKVISDFPLFLDGFSVTSGVASTTVAGVHTVSETSSFGYSSAIGGDCAVSGTITLAPGDNKLCVITNDDLSGGQQGGGGTDTNVPPVPPVPPLIDVVKVPSPLSLPNGPGLVKYTYTLRNIGTVQVTDITMLGDTCSPIVLTSGDTNVDAKLDLNETWTYTCSTTIAQTHTNIVTATGWANGISAVDIANATVVVGIPIVPPLIHITKIPNPLTLPNGSGMVTYTKKVTNPGTVALSNIQVADDKCSPVKYISGDINNNSKLDTTETWTYTCQANLTKTTTNTAIASGSANGLTARDFAIATVVAAVAAASSTSAVPKLPNTGLTPISGIIIISGVLLLALISYFVILKKRRI